MKAQHKLPSLIQPNVSEFIAHTHGHDLWWSSDRKEIYVVVDGDFNKTSSAGLTWVYSHPVIRGPVVDFIRTYIAITR